MIDGCKFVIQRLAWRTEFKSAVDHLIHNTFRLPLTTTRPRKRCRASMNDVRSRAVGKGKQCLRNRGRPTWHNNTLKKHQLFVALSLESVRKVHAGLHQGFAASTPNDQPDVGAKPNQNRQRWSDSSRTRGAGIDPCLHEIAELLLSSRRRLPSGAGLPRPSHQVVACDMVMQ